MSDTPPDRLSSDPRSRFHAAAALERGLGVRFNGEEKTNVAEYCVSEGWVRLPFGKALDRRGNPMTVKVKVTVEPWFKDALPEHPTTWVSSRCARSTPRPAGPARGSRAPPPS